MLLAVEDVLSELAGEERNERGLPPGFRFHPTDEELITFYLASKLLLLHACLHIPEVDLNRCEPWELPQTAKMGEREWYFYSLRDRKYPTGLRTNRATTAGYWKATGKDKEVFSGGGGGGGGALVGMKKTLVFYKGRAPRGVKTKWVMHEYRLESDQSHRHTCKEEWVICRVFNKTGDRKNIGIIHNQISYIHNTSQATTHNHNYNNYHHHHHHHHYQTLPPLQEPTKTLIYHHQNYNNNLVHVSLGHNVDEVKALINPVMSQFNEEGDNFGVKTEQSLNFCNNDLDVKDYLENPLFQEAGYSMLGLSSSSGPLFTCY